MLLNYLTRRRTGYFDLNQSTNNMFAGWAQQCTWLRFPIAAVLAERSRHAAQVIGLERTVGSIRPNHRHVSDVVANLKVMYAIAELIDFPNDTPRTNGGWRRAVWG